MANAHVEALYFRGYGYIKGSMAAQMRMSDRQNAFLLLGGACSGSD